MQTLKRLGVPEHVSGKLSSPLLRERFESLEGMEQLVAKTFF